MKRLVAVVAMWREAPSCLVLVLAQDIHTYMLKLTYVSFDVALEWIVEFLLKSFELLIVFERVNNTVNPTNALILHILLTSHKICCKVGTYMSYIVLLSKISYFFHTLVFLQYLSAKYTVLLFLTKYVKLQIQKTLVLIFNF